LFSIIVVILSLCRKQELTEFILYSAIILVSHICAQSRSCYISWR